MLLMRKSDGQDKHTIFRAGTRFFCVDMKWFYSTREGDIGPFPTEEQAAKHLRTFIELEKLKAVHKGKVETIRKQKITADPKVWGGQIDVL